MTRTVLTYGLIAGILNTVLMLAAMPLYMKDGQMNFQLGELLGYASMIVALSMIFFGVRHYRDRQPGGRLSFREAFKIGVLITLVASAIYVIGWMLYSNIGPGQDFMEQYYRYSVEQIRASEASQEEIDRKIAEMEQFKEMYRRPLVQIGVTFLEIFPVGLIVSLISAVILKRK